MTLRHRRTKTPLQTEAQSREYRFNTQSSVDFRGNQYSLTITTGYYYYYLIIENWCCSPSSLHICIQIMH